MSKIEEWTLYVDPDTGDFIIGEDGMLKTVENNNAIAQGIRLTLLAYKGEFFSDEEHGTRHKELSGQKPHSLNDDLIDEVIREAVFQESRVAQIDSIGYAWDEEKRKLAMNFEAVLIDGSTLRMEGIYV